MNNKKGRCISPARPYPYPFHNYSGLDKTPLSLKKIKIDGEGGGVSAQQTKHWISPKIKQKYFLKIR